MSIIDLIISGCKVFYKNQLIEASIAIDSGKIVKIGKESLMPKAVKKLKYPKAIAIPGIIDVHVHLRDQQLSYKETFETGTKAAAMGGITTVLDMPNNSPITNSTETLNERMKLARNKIYVNVGFYSALPTRIEKIENIIKAGAIGFKLNLCRPIGDFNVDDDDLIIEALKILKKHDFPISIHAEDKQTVNNLEEHWRKINLQDPEILIKTHPPEAEIKSVMRMIGLAKKVGAKIHFAHISTADAVKMISENKELITCEVTPHHLYLTQEKVKQFKGIAIMEPPLRTKRDLEVLWKGIGEGWIDIIASDHAPHTLNEKVSSNIWSIKPGIPGLETMLPLMLTAVNQNRISLKKIIELMCINPSKIFKLKNKGKIEEGYDADITIIDLNIERKINSSKFKSKAKYTPFEGFKVKGAPIATIVSGELVAEYDEVIKPAGKIIRSCEVHS